jgi:hypothetical protein
VLVHRKADARVAHVGPIVVCCAGREGPVRQRMNGHGGYRLPSGDCQVQWVGSMKGCTQVYCATGWRWRHREIWLHVDESNTPAVEMYLKSGYCVVRRERDPIIPLQQRILMKKTLAQRSAASAPTPSSSGEAPQEADVQGSKVFVWGPNEP